MMELIERFAQSLPPSDTSTFADVRDIDLMAAIELYIRCEDCGAEVPRG